MSNASLADQLDDAIERIITEPVSAAAKVDLKMAALLGIASELRLLPDPRFRAALKAELLEKCAEPVGAQAWMRVSIRRFRSRAQAGGHPLRWRR